MSPATDRQQYRQVLADLAAKAKETLGEAMHKRIDCAVGLVLRGDVTLQDDGTALVSSRTEPLKVYTVNGTCGCQDFSRAPAEGWCSHRISRALAIRLARELGAAPDQADNCQLETTQPPQDQDYLSNLETPAPVAPEPLYEARSSANVRITVAGHDVQITLRDHDEARLLVRLEEVLQRYPLPQPTPAQPQGQEPREGWCSKHGVQMRWNEGKDGRKGWWSHRNTTDGSWCKGR